jgi:uncharacterized membrane protein YphA (DoxX/SURF4 family)
LGAALALFAIAGIIFWRFRYYMASDEWVRTFGLPPQAPWHVAIWILVATALIFVGVIISPSPL